MESPFTGYHTDMDRVAGAVLSHPDPDKVNTPTVR